MSHILHNGNNVLDAHRAVKKITINPGGAGAQTAGLFVVTGIVVIVDFYGYVETATLSAGITAAQLDIFPTAGASVIMTKTAGAPAISGFEVGSLLVKGADVGQILEAHRSNVPVFQEAGVALQSVPFSFHVGKDIAAVTTIRFLYTSDGDHSGETGQIDWICQWKHLSHDGNLVAA